jgi:hypothetical protein
MRCLYSGPIVLSIYSPDDDDYLIMHVNFVVILLTCSISECRCFYGFCGTVNKWNEMKLPWNLCTFPIQLCRGLDLYRQYLRHYEMFVPQSLHNKLQIEKSRLAVAVQACEAAAACISRPSSPQDTMPPPIPDRELIVRARLEDMIDQVQLHLLFTILISVNNFCCPQVLYERIIFWFIWKAS